MMCLLIPVSVYNWSINANNQSGDANYYFDTVATRAPFAGM